MSEQELGINKKLRSGVEDLLLVTNWQSLVVKSVKIVRIISFGNGNEKVCSNFHSQWCNIKVAKDGTVTVVGGVPYCWR